MTNSLRKACRTLTLLLFVCASAQVIACAQQAYKIDENTRPRCDLGEMFQIIDSDMPVFVALKEHPRARVAIVVHGLPGESIVYAREVREWLTEKRGVAPERL